METAPCPHCGTPNFTNLVACYYCGRRLASISDSIPDDLPKYDAPKGEERYPSVVSAVSGFVALLFAFGLTGFCALGLIIVLIYAAPFVLLFTFTGSFFLIPSLAILGFSGYLLVSIPYIFQLFWNWGVTRGPRIWMKFRRWCDEVRSHFQKVRADQI